ncbi:putative reverse transcriptase domain-containing protein [Tanacetum coccineum]
MCCLCSWFSEQVGLAGDQGSTNNVLIPWSAGNSEETITTDVGVSDVPENADNNSEVECAINIASKKQCVRNRGNNVLSSSSSSCVASVSHDSNNHVDSLLQPLARSDQCEEEVTEAMTEPTMEEYMTKTLEDYGSGIARPKIDDKAHFKLKGQFLKELRDNTFSGSDNEDANEHIEKELSKYCPPARTAKKIEEINKFQQDPDETLYHAWERFKELLLRCPQHYLKDMQEVILFYKALDVPTRQILDSKGAIPSMKAADAKKAIQDMADHSQKWHNRTSTRTRSTYTSDGLATIQAQLNNLGGRLRKYRAAASGFYQRDNGNPSYKSKAENVLVGIDKFVFPVDFIVLDMPKDIKGPLILERPFLSSAHAKIHVFKKKIALRVGDDKIVFKSENLASNIIRRVFALGLRERMELDLEVRLIGEALILNRSLDPMYGDFIKLNDLNEPLELSVRNTKVSVTSIDIIR